MKRRIEAAVLVGSCLTYRGREGECRVAGCRHEWDFGALKLCSWSRQIWRIREMEKVVKMREGKSRLEKAQTFGRDEGNGRDESE